MSADIDRDDLSHLLGLVAAHERWRGDCLNLVASENRHGEVVRRLLACDLAGRYGDYHGRDLRQRKYMGTRYIVEIEELADRLVRELFHAQYAELRALSGHLAATATILALTRPGDTVLEVDRNGGGHRTAGKLAASTGFPLTVRALPFDALAHTVDADAAIGLMRETRPRLVILGSSTFLFPHPVEVLAQAARELEGTFLIYDGAHVMGLLAAGLFQAPLEDGAHLIVGSSHKVVPGPQGGLILANDGALVTRVSEAVHPGLIANHHLARVAALAATFIEMKASGRAYARQTVQNAQALGAALDARGIRVVGSQRGYTQSHTVVVLPPPSTEAGTAAERLEAGGIIVTVCALDPSLGGAGLRFGVQEVTRAGATVEIMDDIAGLVVEALGSDRSPGTTAGKVREFVAERLSKRPYDLLRPAEAADA